MSEQKPLLLRVKEVAELCRIPLPEAYKLIHEGVFPSIRLGPKRIRVPRQRLEEVLNQMSELKIG